MKTLTTQQSNALRNLKRCKSDSNLYEISHKGYIYVMGIMMVDELKVYCTDGSKNNKTVAAWYKQLPDELKLMVNRTAEKDSRYEVLKYFLCEAKNNKKKILYFQDIFEFVPKTRIATDMGMKVDAFKINLDDPKGWSIRAFFRLAEKAEIDPFEFIFLVAREYWERNNIPIPERFKSLVTE